MFFVLLFTTINFFSLDYLNKSVCTLNNIPLLVKKESLPNQIWYSFAYTATIFFRLTLKIENFNFKNKGGSSYLIAIYTVGLICLAYMASFVIER